jgi:hypothetical protein
MYLRTSLMVTFQRGLFVSLFVSVVFVRSIAAGWTNNELDDQSEHVRARRFFTQIAVTI